MRQNVSQNDHEEKKGPKLWPRKTKQNRKLEINNAVGFLCSPASVSPDTLKHVWATSQQWKCEKSARGKHFMISMVRATLDGRFVITLHEKMEVISTISSVHCWYSTHWALLKQKTDAKRRVLANTQLFKRWKHSWRPCQRAWPKSNVKKQRRNFLPWMTSCFLLLRMFCRLMVHFEHRRCFSYRVVYTNVLLHTACNKWSYRLLLSARLVVQCDNF